MNDIINQAGVIYDGISNNETIIHRAGLKINVVSPFGGHLEFLNFGAANFKNDVDTDKLWFFIYGENVTKLQKFYQCPDHLHHKSDFLYIPWLLKHGIEVSFAWVTGGTYVINWPDCTFWRSNRYRK